MAAKTKLLNKFGHAFVAAYATVAVAGGAHASALSEEQVDKAAFYGAIDGISEVCEATLKQTQEYQDAKVDWLVDFTIKASVDDLTDFGHLRTLVHKEVAKSMNVAGAANQRKECIKYLEMKRSVVGGFLKNEVSQFPEKASECGPWRRTDANGH